MTSRKTEFEPKEVWQDVLLGDDRYFQLATGGTPSTERQEYWENGTVPWLSSGEVHKKIIRFADGRITEEGFQHSNARFYPTHSILIALAGQGKTRGTAAITEIEVTSNQSIAAVIPNKELVEPYFVYYYVDWLYQELRSMSAGAGRAGLNLSILAKVPIKLPNKLVQERIAAVLSCIDRGIGYTEAVIGKHQHIKTGLIHDLLTKGIDEHGNIRSETTHEFKDSALGRIPKEWDVERFGEACEKVSVGIATSTAKHFADDGIPLIRNQNVKENGFDTNDVLFITRKFDEANKNKRLRPLDIVIVRTGYPGLSSVVPEEMAGWQTFTTLISRPRQSRYDSHFLSLLINSDVCKRQIANLQAGGAQQNLNVGWIVNMTVLRPPRQEQADIVHLLDSLEANIWNARAKVSKFRRLKAGLMQDLLTGKVSVKSLLVEVGAVNA